MSSLQFLSQLFDNIERKNLLQLDSNRFYIHFQLLKIFLCRKPLHKKVGIIVFFLESIGYPNSTMRFNQCACTVLKRLSFNIRSILSYWSSFSSRIISPRAVLPSLFLPELITFLFSEFVKIDIFEI